MIVTERERVNVAAAKIDTYRKRQSDWPELKPIPAPSTPRADAYPFDGLGPILGNAARAIARDVQAPDALAGGAVLAAASLAAQPLANVIMPHGQRAPLSVYVVTSASSGDRKSAVDAVACHEIEQVRQHQAREYTRAMNQHAAEGDKNSPPPPPRSLTTGNATIEGLTRLLKHQSHVGVFSAEGGEMLGGHSMREDRRASGLAFFLKGWGAEPLDSMRGGEGLTVLLGRRVAMHILVQPVLMSQLMTDPLASGQGLHARCLIAQPDTLAGSRMFRPVNPLESPEVVAYNAHIKALLESTPDYWPEGDGYELKPRDLILSDDARALWIAFYNEIERQQGDSGQLEGARAFASKAAEHAARIAAIVTMTADPGALLVSSDAMEGAIRVAAFYIGEHLRLTGTGQAYRHIQELTALWDWLKTQEIVTPREVMQKAPRAIRKLKKEGIDQLLAELQARGYVRQQGNAWEIRRVQD